MSTGRRRFDSRVWVRVLGIVGAIAIAHPAAAQETASADGPEQVIQQPPPIPPKVPPATGGLTFRGAMGDFGGGWVPLGSAPVDQAGAGRRGYVLAGEDSTVTAAGSNQLSIHTVAANDFYREENPQFVVNQRYEAHTIALDFRHGFKFPNIPRFELGGQVQLHESDNGMLNGLIVGVESFWAGMTGYHESRNELRLQGATPPPLGTTIVKDGKPLYTQSGGASGVGDMSAMLKIALVDAQPSSYIPHVSLRFGLNRAGSSSFSEGNYFGAGMSFDQKVSEFLAFHADIRVTRALDDVSMWNLPLTPWTHGFSVGPEFRLPKNSSLNIQVDGSSTPYRPTGALAFDEGYGDITFGLGHRFSRHVVAQLYVRENMNLPWKVRWNTDPDMSLGIKVRVY